MVKKIIIGLVVLVVVVGVGYILIGNTDKKEMKEAGGIEDVKGVEERTKTEDEGVELVAVDGSDSNGTAYRVVENNDLFHSVTANMPDPAEGSSYEGWLVQPSPLKFFSTGVMEKNQDNIWVLEYTAQEPFPTYLKVVITEETVVDAVPEKHIIEGDFLAD